MSTKRKIMLIGAVIGVIIGAVIAISGSYYADNPLYELGVRGVVHPDAVFAGIWFGIGFGGNIDLITDIPRLFSIGLERDGLVEAIKTTLGGSLVWAIIFTVLGPIGFLVRFFRNA